MYELRRSERAETNDRVADIKPSDSMGAEQDVKPLRITNERVAAVESHHEAFGRVKLQNTAHIEREISRSLDRRIELCYAIHYRDRTG